MTTITIYAAVIEWPGELADADTRLILAVDESDRDVQIAEELRDMAASLTDPQWRNAIANADGVPWLGLVEMLEETEYNSPFVSLYTQEVSA